MDFYDRILIKLKRQYSKDEVVAALIKKLSEREIEAGKLKDEIDCLREELKLNTEQKEINRAGKIEARKDDLYKLKVEECKKQREKIRQLTNQRNDLIAKVYAYQNNIDIIS